MEQITITDLAANVSFGIILLYLTFRIFKVLDALVSKIDNIQVMIVVEDRGLNTLPPDPP